MQGLGVIRDSPHDSEVNQSMLQYSKKTVQRHKCKCFCCSDIHLYSLVDSQNGLILKLFQNPPLCASVIGVLMRWCLDEVHYPTRKVSRGSTSQQLVHQRACFWRE